MAYAGTAIRLPDIRIPRIAPPQLRWPQFSQRTRALLMLGLMISPCFLAESFGYCVQRLFYTADQLAARQPLDDVLALVDRHDVACPTAAMSVGERGLWAEYATQVGWPPYPQAGPGCFKPEHNLRGVVGLKVFMVACPNRLLSALDRRRWLSYAAAHDWAPYPLAGADCVDP